MYIRFQGRVKNERTNTYLGIFQIAYELRDSDKLEKHHEKELLKNIQWLKTHLKNPKELNIEENYRAISWFSTKAHEPMKRIRSIKVILEEHGYIIDTIKSKDPGIVIYEDGWQIVAKPRKTHNKAIKKDV